MERPDWLMGSLPLPPVVHNLGTTKVRPGQDFIQIYPNYDSSTKNEWYTSISSDSVVSISIRWHINFFLPFVLNRIVLQCLSKQYFLAKQCCIRRVSWVLFDSAENNLQLGSRESPQEETVASNSSTSNSQGWFVKSWKVNTDFGLLNSLKDGVDLNKKGPLTSPLCMV